MVEILTAETRLEAQQILANKQTFLAAICLNTDICEPFALPLVRFSKAYRPATPLFLLANSPEKSPEEKDAASMHIQRVIQKPLKKTELLNILFPYSYFELEKALNIASKDKTAVDETVSLNDGDMHAIAAKDFLCGTKSFFDVFVRLGNGKYVKLLKAGDSFDSERVKSYITKGVTHFFIKVEAQEFFLQYCDKLTESLLKNKEGFVGVKMAQVQNFGKETLEFLKSRGINEITLQSAGQFVRHANELVKQLNPVRYYILKSFLNNMALCDHGTGTVMIVSMLCDKLDYKDEKILDVITLSAFLHDIGLLQMPAHFIDEDIDALKPEEVALFETHPTVGAELVRSIRMINPLIPQAIEQHHERRNRHGFPKKLGPGVISPVSELIGIADTFHQLIKRAEKNKDLDPLEEMRKIHFDQFSFPVIDAFCQIFLPDEAQRTKKKRTA